LDAFIDGRRFRIWRSSTTSAAKAWTCECLALIADTSLPACGSA
jgi:hypothetical protein